MVALHKRESLHCGSAGLVLNFSLNYPHKYIFPLKETNIKLILTFENISQQNGGIFQMISHKFLPENKTNMVFGFLKSFKHGAHPIRMMTSLTVTKNVDKCRDGPRPATGLPLPLRGYSSIFCARK